MDFASNPGYTRSWVKDRYLGNLGRQDSEFDNTLAEWAGDAPLPVRNTNFLLGLLVTLCVILPGGILVLAALAARKFIKERLCQ